MKFTAAQLAEIQIDYGLVYVDYSEASERILGPTRGGAEFTATQQIRDIEFDGRNGKTKDMQHVDFIDAMLKVTSIATSEDDLTLALPWLTVAGVAGSKTFTAGPTDLGMVASADYLTNITVFGKKTGGDYVKITLYHAMNEAPFTLAAVPKGEGTVNLEVHAHWEADAADTVDKLFEITHVASIT